MAMKWIPNKLALKYKDVFIYHIYRHDDHEGGVFAGGKMIELLGEEGGKIAVISAVAGAVQEGGRAQGFIDAITDNGNSNYEILGPFYGDGDRSKTFSIMQDVLTANPDLKAVYSCNEGSSAGALLGVQEEGGDLTFIAFDPNADMHQPIRDGIITAGIAQNPFLIGYTATESVIKVLNGEEVEKKIASLSGSAESELYGSSTETVVDSSSSVASGSSVKTVSGKSEKIDD